MTDDTSAQRRNAVQMIKRGANLDCKGEGAGSPIARSRYQRAIGFRRLLLAHGAHIDAKDDNSKTPLATGLEYKRDEVAAFLRKHGGKE
jgi:ankyrin repeat protein